ncbi:MAG: Riboflavin biosynthesis protein RibF [Calditrichaeota bacterium]|nr:Riboflavin biosynthesis protein RibF [Calditrichota bacterium]
MEVYQYGTQQIPRRDEASVTIGTFDGVHLGHHHLLAEVVSGRRPTVVTFDPHPRHVLSPGQERLKLLTPTGEKLRKLERMGIERVIVIPFSREIAQLPAETFLRDILVGTIGLARLVVGFNHSFGRNREGNLDFMRERAPVYGYELVIVEAHEEDEAAVSSTRIRLAIEGGRMRDANRYLGGRYRTPATVTTGEGRGRELGYPTANLRLVDPDQLIPAEGVYAVRVKLGDGRWYDGVASVGHKETFGPRLELSVEVHIFDVDRELHGQVIVVEWVDFLRGQEAFDSAEQLIAQMDDDSERARQVLARA